MLLHGGYVDKGFTHLFCSRFGEAAKGFCRSYPHGSCHSAALYAIYLLLVYLVHYTCMLKIQETEGVLNV